MAIDFLSVSDARPFVGWVVEASRFVPTPVVARAFFSRLSAFLISRLPDDQASANPHAPRIQAVNDAHDVFHDYLGTLPQRVLMAELAFAALAHCLRSWLERNDTAKNLKRSTMPDAKSAGDFLCKAKK